MIKRIEDLPIHEQVICAILGLHETGRWYRKYDKVVFSENDPGGLSVGWGQAAFQTKTRFLGKMLAAYADHPQALYAAQLRPHLVGLERYWDGTVQGVRYSRGVQADPALHTILRQMGADPAWQAIQDQRFVQELDKARDICAARGWTSHLALLAAFDQVIQGPVWMIERAEKALNGEGEQAYIDLIRKGTEDYYGNAWEGCEEYDPDNEEDFLWAWYLLRIDFLMTEGYSEASRKSWPPSTYRCAHILNMIAAGTWTLEWGSPFHTYHPGYYKDRDWAITKDLVTGRIS